MIVPPAPNAAVVALAGSAAQQRNLAPVRPAQAVTARPTLPTQKAEKGQQTHARRREDQEIDEEAWTRGRNADVSV
ncbi:MAG: hypothetical protein EAZ99_11555 [Alphaproteobacteria bacterium]|nr:MAG: hypothetical protein EAZ99_11555 [Alphaproteobacteria bacterium]